MRAGSAADTPPRLADDSVVAEGAELDRIQAEVVGEDLVRVLAEERRALHRDVALRHSRREAQQRNLGVFRKVERVHEAALDQMRIWEEIARLDGRRSRYAGLAQDLHHFALLCGSNEKHAG